MNVLLVHAHSVACLTVALVLAFIDYLTSVETPSGVSNMVELMLVYMCFCMSNTNNIFVKSQISVQICWISINEK